MKRKSIAVCLLAIALVGVLIYFVMPKSIAANIDQLDIQRVTLYEEDGKQKDISSQVDMNQLKDIISSYKCSRMTKSFDPYLLKSVIYEISGTYANEPLHIILGDLNIVYESGNKGGHVIRNSEKMILDINNLLPQN